MFIIRAEDMSISNGIFKVLNRIKDFDLNNFFSYLLRCSSRASLSLSLSLIEDGESRKLGFFIIKA